MDFGNRNTVLAIGAGVAVLAGVILAVMVFGKDKGDAAPPADKGSLSVSVAEAPTLDPTRKLRCYVNGQFVGETSLADCARKNGVSAQSLDVGLDESGALVAAQTASLAPPPVLPPPTEMETAPDADTPPAEEQRPSTVAENNTTSDFDLAPTPASGSACLRFTGSDWRQLSPGTSLETCKRLLFEGQCVRPGEANYGRWGDTTLRLVPGRIEQSSDNRRFRTVERRPSC
ncbi:MAG: hypothetical protein K1X35_03445 [Caulobacteraceae bacterium]|nr:hypothetical protein [Caulobacteraceae bacterium]